MLILFFTLFCLAIMTADWRKQRKMKTPNRKARKRMKEAEEHWKKMEKERGNEV